MPIALLSPTEFAGLSLAEKRRYQTQQAEDIFRRMQVGAPVTDAERDFAFRVLGKRMPEVPTPTGFENTAKAIEDIAAGVGAGTFKAIWPVLLLAALAAVIIWGTKK